jgi:hypothetical protein
LYADWSIGQGADTDGGAKKSALTTAAANGYSNDGVTSTVVVNIPPLTGDHVGEKGYAEVIVTCYEPRFFSKIWGTATLPVKARAVARGVKNVGSPGILVLDPTGNNSLDLTASGNVTVTNHGAVVVDSNSPNGGLTFTSTGNVTADNINLSDNVHNKSNSGGPIGTVNYNCSPTPDPLASLTEPAQPAYPPTPPSLTGLNYSTNNGVNYSGSATLDLYPGYYAGINVTGSGSVVLHDNVDGSPGIYWIGSQGFSATNAGGISGSNVLIYSNGTGNISLTGTGSVTISPPTTGPYQGISIWQERTSNKQVSITASGNMDIQGTFYAAAAKVTITNNGSLNNTIASQWIAYDLSVTGTGSMTVAYQGNPNTYKQLGLVE